MRYLLVMLSLLLSLQVPAAELSPKPDHTAWNILLQKYVNAGGKVNYKGLQLDGKALRTYLDELAAKPPQTDWSRQEAMSYWINAYNAFTVALILEHYPVKSIRDIHNGEPWDVKWIQLGGNTYSLNQIEHEVLRPKYQDARIHFAVNCAARSCPPLLNEAFTAAKLEAQLERVTYAFINNNEFNQFTDSRIQLSKIFEWYAEDFPQLLPFLQQYRRQTLPAKPKIGYNEYDWGLNELVVRD
jgi:hypothetical protein